MNTLISCNYTFGRHSLLLGDWTWRNVVIPDNKIYLVTEGELVVETPDYKSVLKAGDMILIPAYMPHSCYLTGKRFAKKSWIHFNMKQGSSDFFSEYQIPLKIELENVEEAYRLIDVAVSLDKLPEPQKTLKTSAAIYELVSMFFTGNEYIPTKQPKTDVDKALEYINSNYTENFSLDFLAEKFGYTPNHFIKKFKEKTGYTPIKYLNAQKIEEAKRLLEHTKMPVSKIMEKVGFFDSAYFSKLFKKATGYSPRGLREQLKNKQ